MDNWFGCHVGPSCNAQQVRIDRDGLGQGAAIGTIGQVTGSNGSADQLSTNIHLSVEVNPGQVLSIEASRVEFV